MGVLIIAHWAIRADLDDTAVQSIADVYHGLCSLDEVSINV